MSQRCGFLAYDWCLIFRIVIIFVFIFTNTSPWIIIIGGIEGAPWLIRAAETLQGADRIPSYQTTPYPNVWVCTLYTTIHTWHIPIGHQTVKQYSSYPTMSIGLSNVHTKAYHITVRYTMKRHPTMFLYNVQCAKETWVEPRGSSQTA